MHEIIDGLFIGTVQDACQVISTKCFKQNFLFVKIKNVWMRPFFKLVKTMSSGHILAWQTYPPPAEDNLTRFEKTIFYFYFLMGAILNIVLILFLHSKCNLGIKWSNALDPKYQLWARFWNKHAADRENYQKTGSAKITKKTENTLGYFESGSSSRARHGSPKITKKSKNTLGFFRILVGLLKSGFNK